jgi:protein-tyrosine-phosphatase
MKVLLSFLSLIALLHAADAPPRKVVFVCEHGAAKSVLAAAEFERMAKDRGLSLTAIARGTDIDPELAASVVKGLQSDGLKPGISKPVKVAAQDTAGAARVVSFGPDLKAVVPKGGTLLDWSATPSPGKDYKAARDYIRKQLEGLFVQLEAESKR